MAPRKWNKKSKNPSVAKAKKVVNKFQKKQGMKNADTYPLTCKTFAQAFPQQGATVANYYYGNFPLFTNGSPPAYDVRNNPQFKMNCVLYDRFRINSITVKWVPKANVFDLAQAQNDTTLNVTGTGIIYTAVDRDSSVPVNLQAFQKMSSVKAYSVLKPFSRRYTITWPKGQWLDTEYPSTLGQITATLGGNGGITIYGENFVEDSGEIFNEPIASIEITYNLVFQGKTQSGATMDSSGNVVISKLQDKELMDISGNMTKVSLDL